MIEKTQQNILIMIIRSPKWVLPELKHPGESVAHPDNKYAPTTLMIADDHTFQLSLVPKPGRQYSTIGTTMTYMAV
jgi:hypothetical protein